MNKATKRLWHETLRVFAVSMSLGTCGLPNSNISFYSRLLLHQGGNFELTASFSSYSCCQQGGRKIAARERQQRKMPAWKDIL